MRKLSIYTAIKNYAKQNPSRFHMPGHKAEKSFAKLFPSGKIDITELSFSDNLQNPNGIIAEAEKNIAEIIGAKKSCILTDGSTSGIYSSLYIARKHTKKLAVLRTSHESVFRAATLFDLDLIIIDGEYKNGGYYYSEKKIIEAVLSDKECFGLLITTPDYFGNTLNVKEIKLGIGERLLISDSAHGLHLLFNQKDNGINNADIVIFGAHKTIPTLTQGALLCLNNEKLTDSAEKALKIFRTSSPSYPIMASVEYGVYYMEDKGKQKLTELSDEIHKFKQNAELFGIRFCETDDETKIIIDCVKSCLDSEKINNILERNDIYAELVSRERILFMASVGTGKDDLKRLLKILKRTVNECFRQLVPSFLPKSECVFGYLETDGKEREIIELTECANRISAENIGVFPPCYPVALKGERMSIEAVKFLMESEGVYGLTDGKVSVIKERKQ